ncbi:hypothetical protein ACFPN2_24170 [Steroidobacter flavus]|uniref:DUF304 domain-containing protein n=1 Tax=Steroidobacter flavus TaxID=1842136 RepID=A0ABV8SYH9_9GAMM
MTPRQYDLFLTGMQKFAIGAPLLVLIIFPVFFLTVFNEAGPPDAPFFRFVPLLFLIVFLGIYAATTLRLPYRISVTRDRQLVFKSVLKTQTVRVSELLSIQPKNLNVQAGISGYELEHRNGKIRFPGQFTDQYLLLYELKQANPALKTKGC